MNESGQALVTVVTPFHNGEQYIRQCIESVLAQTHSNFEYYLVDNHSKDGASEIAREYAARDARIRVVSPATFVPQVENYNFGLSQVSPSAKFFKVVAADDWIFPSCLTEMVKLAETNAKIGIVSSYRLRETKVEGEGLSPEQRVVSGRDACRISLIRGAFLFGSPTTLLFRRELLDERQPFYETGRLHEDTEAVFEILRRWDFGYVHQILSFSRQQLDSVTGSRRNFGMDALDRLITVTKFGPHYLDAEELRASLSHATRWHYSVMADAWLEERVHPIAKGFWEYQRTGLTSVGKQIEPRLLATAVAKRIARGVLSPIDTTRRLSRTLGRSATA